eukprot:scaffold1123_cov213-Alexandrium_tamarense.AAC.17
MENRTLSCSKTTLSPIHSLYPFLSPRLSAFIEKRQSSHNLLLPANLEGYPSKAHRTRTLI